jgi:sodium-dependent dicarboxylate transporter 2/3/5
LAFAALAPIAKELAGGAHGAWSVVTITFGDWLTVFIMLCLVMTHALTSCGFMRRVAVWFLTRRIAQKSAWSFTVFFLVMAFMVGFLVDAVVSTVFLLGFAYEFFDRLGYKKGDSYPSMMVICITYCAILGYTTTPLGHGAGLVGMGVYAGVSGETIPLLSYMLAALPIGILCWIGMVLFSRYVVKPDVSNFERADFNAIVGEKPGPMDKREKMTVGIYAFVCVFWIIPGIFSILTPAAEITHLLEEMTAVIPVEIGLVLMLIIKTDGKPLLDFGAAVKSVPWGIIFMIATSRAMAALLVRDGTGFNAFITGVLGSAVGTVSTFAIMFLIVIVLSVCTNFTNNLPLTTLFVSVLVPQAAVIGAHPAVIAVIVTFICQSAYTLPSGFATIAMLYGNEWSKPRFILKSGLFQVILTIILVGIPGYLLANLIVG